ncbi:MAG: hypothetical protein IKH51_06630 [Clostridia bacterium]|nr:hypothetical protein [Clostridia bacterium]
MKRFLTVLSLVLLVFAQSCGKEPAETEKETVALPEPASESYGTGWAYAGMDEQILADDPDFAVTGSGFEYRDGWLGAGDGGYFDLTVNYEPGSDEKFCFEFDAYIKDGGALWFGFWLYSKNSLPDDGMPGEWIKLREHSALYGGVPYETGKKETVKIKLTASPDGFAVYADGTEIIRTDQGSANGGGAIKLRSEDAPVYISNIAFRLGN